MSQIRIDTEKATKKWKPILENMGVTNEEKIGWLSEYAEYHSINENAYANATIAGMGPVVNPIVGSLPGVLQGAAYNGVPGSGDLGQNLLPVAMKIAAQTIGLDLVAVKPSPGPKIDLLYIDFQYDDLQNVGNEARPQVFKINWAYQAVAGGVAVNPTASAIQTALTSFVTTNGGIFTSGGFTGLQIWAQIATSSTIPGAPTTNTTGFYTSDPTQTFSSDAGFVQFLGFSRIDGYPMFRAYRQANAWAGSNPGSYNVFAFDSTQNTFAYASSMTSQIQMMGTWSTTGTGLTIELVSALEDHLPGFSANWTAFLTSGDYPMSRGTDDNTYSGIIGPQISAKTIAVGTIEVSTALRRTEIEDIKANTGMDIVQKMESILVNELSQTISKQIVYEVFSLGEENRSTAPLIAGKTYTTGSTVCTIFDLDTSYVFNGPGGETTHAVQRKLITKMVHASNYIATEGRIGPAQYAVTNGGIAAALMDIAGYTINPLKSKLNGQGQLYPVGQIGDIQIYVDPYMKYNDNRICIGRKNNPDQPGLIFVPYLMAQSISLISEATFAPRMLLRSRYAIADVGFFPQKQFMNIYVVDSNHYLN